MDQPVHARRRRANTILQGTYTIACNTMPVTTREPYAISYTKKDHLVSPHFFSILLHLDSSMSVRVLLERELISDYKNEILLTWKYWWEMTRTFQFYSAHAVISMRKSRGTNHVMYRRWYNCVVQVPCTRHDRIGESASPMGLVATSILLLGPQSDQSYLVPPYYRNHYRNRKYR